MSVDSESVVERIPARDLERGHRVQWRDTRPAVVTSVSSFRVPDGPLVLVTVRLPDGDHDEATFAPEDPILLATTHEAEPCRS